MEERLFFIGASMGVYAWATRRWAKDGKLDGRGATAFWHAVFCGLVGFAVALVLAMSWESRAKVQSTAVGLVSSRDLLISLAAAAALGLWGALRAWKLAASQEGRQYYHTEDLEWAETVFSAVLLAALMMYFVLQAFKIPSGSMRATLLEGDHLFVNKFIYGTRIPFTGTRVLRLRPVGRGEIVVFRFPSDDPAGVNCGTSQYGKDFIKRVIGLPGDELRVVDGRLYVNGGLFGPEPYAQHIDGGRQPKPPAVYSEAEYQRLWEGRQLDKGLGSGMRDHFGPVKVPPDSYFMMGDNRDFSCDSRFWGPVPMRYIKGRAWVVYWPPRRMGSVHGRAPEAER